MHFFSLKRRKCYNCINEWQFYQLTNWRCGKLSNLRDMARKKDNLYILPYSESIALHHEMLTCLFSSPSTGPQKMVHSHQQECCNIQGCLLGNALTTIIWSIYTNIIWIFSTFMGTADPQHCIPCSRIHKTHYWK